MRVNFGQSEVDYAVICNWSNWSLNIHILSFLNFFGKRIGLNFNDLISLSATFKKNTKKTVKVVNSLTAHDCFFYSITGCVQQREENEEKRIKRNSKKFFLIFFCVKLIRARDLFISKLLLCMRDGREFENNTRNEIKKNYFSWGKKNSR